MRAIGGSMLINTKYTPVVGRRTTKNQSDQKIRFGNSRGPIKTPLVLLLHRCCTKTMENYLYNIAVELVQHISQLSHNRRVCTWVQCKEIHNANIPQTPGMVNHQRGDSAVSIHTTTIAFNSPALNVSA